MYLIGGIIAAVLITGYLIFIFSLKDDSQDAKKDVYSPPEDQGASKNGKAPNAEAIERLRRIHSDQSAAPQSTPGEAIPQTSEEQQAEEASKEYLGPLGVFRLLLFDPRQAFQRSVYVNAPRKAFVTCVVVTLVVFFVQMILQAAFYGGTSFNFFGMPMFLGAMYLSLFVTLFVQTFIIHVACKAFMGEGTFANTFCVVTYSWIVMEVFSVIPWLGLVVGPLWSLYIAVQGLRTAHNLGIGQSLTANVLPVLLVMATAYYFYFAENKQYAEYYQRLNDRLERRIQLKFQEEEWVPFTDILSQLNAEAGDLNILHHQKAAKAGYLMELMGIYTCDYELTETEKKDLFNLYERREELPVERVSAYMLVQSQIDYFLYDVVQSLSLMDRSMETPSACHDEDVAAGGKWHNRIFDNTILENEHYVKYLGRILLSFKSRLMENGILSDSLPDVQEAVYQLEEQVVDGDLLTEREFEDWRQEYAR